jgi:CheY-like chemotaxis protein/peptidoglycan hydrolase CwlO-like protein
MSKPHKLSDYTEFLPKTERRTPLPITNLPVNAISEETDPTLEIRTLIEQLQQTARDARGQVRAIEQERDALVLDLTRSQQQIDLLRENERELRSHFVEVTSLIQERDAALDESERRGQALAEAMKKNEAAIRERNDAQRQRDDAVRQRDESTRKFETFNRSSEEHARITAETQKQLLTIRQARDAAHAQILELNSKLGATEDQLAEVEYQRDAAQKSSKQVTGELADLRRQLDVVTTDRDATAKQVEQLTAELDTQRQKFLDLAEQKTAAQTSDGEHVAALAEARTQVTSLAAERDAARNRAQEQARELEELRGQFQSFREEAAQTSGTALTEAHEKIATFETQARESRHEAKNLRQQLDAMGEQLAALQTVAEQAGAQNNGAREELDALLQDRDAALISLNAAQKQIDHIIRDRDQVRQLATENALELEAQLTSLQSQVTTLENAAAEAEAQKKEIATLNKRFEKQRVETIDLATQLQAAQREVRELSASLAEARLQVKFASAATRAAKDGKTKSDFADLMAESTESAPVAPETAAEEPTTTRPAPLALNIEEPLTEKEAKSALGAMRHCFQSFTKTPTDLSLLNELHCHVQGFSERARISGLIALHRLCTSFADLTRGLYEIPEQVNPSTLRTVHQTIEFLASLMKEKNLAQVKDPAKALIYAVDDDLGNCESIALAMEESMMRTTYAQEPAVALTELAGGRYDLIFLDVNLPGMDGFELCKQIRALAIHATTPVVFLTGLATLENRVQSSLSGGNDFIAKPFNLHELSVKAITLILKAQLQLA